MSLTRKTLLGTALAVLGLIVLLFTVSRALLMSSYERLEAQDTINNVQRVMAALDDQVAGLNLIALGWSKWDDTRDFLSDKNQRYIDVNLVSVTYLDMDTQITVWLDPDSKVVFQKAFDETSEVEMPVPQTFLDQLKPGSALLTHPDVSSEITGLIQIPEGTLIVTSLPVLNSDGSGPMYGTQVWGKFIGDEEIRDLAKTTRLDITLFRYDDAALPADFLKAKQTLTSEQPYLVCPLDVERVAGYHVMNDLYGKPILLVKAEMPRGIYAQGRVAVSYFLAALVMISVGFALVSLVLLDRNVLRRLRRLSDTVTRIRATDDLQTPVTLGGHDELSNLAGGLKSMLDQVAASRSQLREANDQLEDAVRLRTQDLQESIALLREEAAERQAAEVKLAQAHDKALEALRFRTQIVANVSHDARTPLTTIGLHADMLKRGAYGTLNEQQKEALDRIHISARQLNAFFQNMLSEAQLSGGKLKLNIGAFQARQLIQPVYQMLTALAERKGLRLMMDIAPDLPPTLTGDVDRLKQILTNLGDNAIKFTDKGAITLRLFAPDNDHWALQVIDSGHGIEPDALRQIFDPFYQVDGSITRGANRGVGLGLSIVKQLVDLMHGQIEVASEVGFGTTFLVTLPHPHATIREVANVIAHHSVD